MFGTRPVTNLATLSFVSLLESEDNTKSLIFGLDVSQDGTKVLCRTKFTGNVEAAMQTINAMVANNLLAHDDKYLNSLHNGNSPALHVKKFYRFKTNHYFTLPNVTLTSAELSTAFNRYWNSLMFRMQYKS